MTRRPEERAAEEVFEVEGLILRLPSASLDDPMRDALRQGFYETGERRLVRARVRRDDRVLDVGAGAGLVAMVAARITGAEAVLAVEANPDMIPVIRRNLRINGLQDVRVIHGAVMGRAHRAPRVVLQVPQAFWAASAMRRPNPAMRPVEVPVKRFPALVRAHRATVAVMDIEGAEHDVLGGPIPDSLRLIVVETHASILGDDAVAGLRGALAARGLTVVDEVKGGAVLAFGRTGRP